MSLLFFFVMLMLFFAFQDGVKVETVTEEGVEISAVKRAKIKRDKMQYGAFLKVKFLN